VWRSVRVLTSTKSAVSGLLLSSSGQEISMRMLLGFLILWLASWNVIAAGDITALAVRLGVRSIEHGRYLDAEGIKLMRIHGTYYVPTIYVGDYYMDPRNGNLRQQDTFNDYSENYRHIFIDLVGKAHRAGVKIAVGLDLGGYNYNASLNARELQTLMEAGMTAMEAIKAATSVAAEMLYQEGQIGSLQVGAYADITAVTEDPLANISALERVSFVMSNGVVIKNHLLK